MTTPNPFDPKQPGGNPWHPSTGKTPTGSYGNGNTNQPAPNQPAPNKPAGETGWPSKPDEPKYGTITQTGTRTSTRNPDGTLTTTTTTNQGSWTAKGTRPDRAPGQAPGGPKESSPAPPNPHPKGSQAWKEHRDKYGWSEEKESTPAGHWRHGGSGNVYPGGGEDPWLRPGERGGPSGTGGSGRPTVRVSGSGGAVAGAVGGAIKGATDAFSRTMQSLTNTFNKVLQNQQASFAASEAARKKAYDNMSSAIKEGAALRRGDINKAAEREKRDAAADAFDPYAKERYDDARKLMQQDFENQKELLALKNQQELELHGKSAELQERNIEGMKAISSEQHKLRLKEIGLQREAAEKTYERQQKDLLSGFKDSLKASVKGIQTSLRRDVQDMEKDIARGGLYQKEEAAERAAREFAIASAQQGASVNAANTAAFAKNAAFAARTSSLDEITDRIRSYEKTGKLFAKQLRAASKTTSIEELRGVEDTYDTVLEKMLDELYERN